MTACDISTPDWPVNDRERGVNFMPRELVILACTECNRRNYTTKRNKKQSERLEIKKFCPSDRKRTLHKEVK